MWRKNVKLYKKITWLLGIAFYVHLSLGINPIQKMGCETQSPNGTRTVKINRVTNQQNPQKSYYTLSISSDEAKIFSTQIADFLGCAFSPNGRFFIYKYSLIENRQIFYHTDIVDTNKPNAIVATQHDQQNYNYYSFSPDSKLLLMKNEQHDIKVIHLANSTTVFQVKNAPCSHWYIKSNALTLFFKQKIQVFLMQNKNSQPTQQKIFEKKIAQIPSSCNINSSALALHYKNKKFSIFSLHTQQKLFSSTQLKKQWQGKIDKWFTINSLKLIGVSLDDFSVHIYRTPSKRNAKPLFTQQHHSRLYNWAIDRNTIALQFENGIFSIFELQKDSYKQLFTETFFQKVVNFSISQDKKIVALLFENNNISIFENNINIAQISLTTDKILQFKIQNDKHLLAQTPTSQQIIKTTTRTSTLKTKVKAQILGWSIKESRDIITLYFPHHIGIYELNTKKNLFNIPHFKTPFYNWDINKDKKLIRFDFIDKQVKIFFKQSSKDTKEVLSEQLSHKIKDWRISQDETKVQLTLENNNQKIFTLDYNTPPIQNSPGQQPHYTPATQVLTKKTPPPSVRPLQVALNHPQKRIKAHTQANHYQPQQQLIINQPQAQQTFPPPITKVINDRFVITQSNISYREQAITFRDKKNQYPTYSGSLENQVILTNVTPDNSCWYYIMKENQNHQNTTPRHTLCTTMLQGSKDQNSRSSSHFTLTIPIDPNTTALLDDTKKYVMIQNKNNAIEIFNLLDKRKKSFRFKGNAFCSAFTVFKNQQLLLWSSIKNTKTTITVLDMEKETYIFEKQLPPNFTPTDALASTNKQFLLLRSQTNAVKIFAMDQASQKCIFEKQLSTNYTPDNFLISANKQFLMLGRPTKNDVRIFNMETKQLLLQLQTPPDQEIPLSFDVSADQQYIKIDHPKKSLIYKAEINQALFYLTDAHIIKNWIVKGDHILLQYKNTNHVCIYKKNQTQFLCIWKGTITNVIASFIVKHNKDLLLQYANHSVKILKLSQQKKEYNFSQLQKQILDFSTSQDKYILFSFDQDYIEIFDIQTSGNTAKPLFAKKLDYHLAQWTINNNHLLLTLTDNTTKLFDLTNNNEIFNKKGIGLILNFTVIPNQYITFKLQNNTTKLFDLTTGNELLSPTTSNITGYGKDKGHTLLQDETNAVEAFSPSGTKLFRKQLSQAPAKWNISNQKKHIAFESENQKKTIFNTEKPEKKPIVFEGATEKIKNIKRTGKKRSRLEMEKQPGNTKTKEKKPKKRKLKM